MVYPWSLSDNKSPQVSKTLLSILADLNNALICIVSTLSVISTSSSICTNPLGTVPRAPITTGFIATFIFHIFFQFFSKVEVLNPLFTFFRFHSVVHQDNKVHNSLLIIIISVCLAVIRWSVCVSKSQRSLCVSFYMTDSGLWIYPLCLFLYSFWASLLHMLSLSPHNLRLLFCWV